MKNKICLGAIAVGLAAATGVWAAETLRTLRVDGTVVSNNVRIIQGQAYVRLSDVAAAFHRTITPTADGYDLTQAGGANQAGEYFGKMGDVIFTGRWRFSVTNVEEKDEYTQQYDNAKATIKPKGDNTDLVIVNCRLKNATKNAQPVYFVSIIPGYQTLPEGRTSLTDQNEHGYPLYAHDAQTEQGVTSTLLPGAAKDFALVFNVPRGMARKDLIFTILTVGGPDSKGTDVRVALQ